MHGASGWKDTRSGFLRPVSCVAVATWGSRRGARRKADISSAMEDACNRPRAFPSTWESSGEVGDKDGPRGRLRPGADGEIAAKGLDAVEGHELSLSAGESPPRAPGVKPIGSVEAEDNDAGFPVALVGSFQDAEDDTELKGAAALGDIPGVEAPGRAQLGENRGLGGAGERVVGKDWHLLEELRGLGKHVVKISYREPAAGKRASASAQPSAVRCGRPENQRGHQGAFLKSSAFRVGTV